MTAKARASERPIAIWLLVCCAMIYGMVILGGVTRLTHSGLSMVQWHPISGVIPPTSHAAWEAEFKNYQKYPEYKDINEGMTLQGFKGIFWLEYFHRLLGRLIGLVFFLPFLYFLVRRRIRRSLLPKLLAMLVLGGLQGLLGWLMVSSGLVNVPHVSPVRLTAHLGLAILIYAFILWVALGLLLPEPEPGFEKAKVARVRRWAVGAMGLVFLMILTGGLVAGTRAGFAFNTFPLMLGHLVPPGILAMHPWWHNFVANVATVQFDHRVMALILTIALPTVAVAVLRTHPTKRARIGAWLLMAMLVVQVSLGIATLLLVVPTPLAAAHQAGAVLLLTFAIFLARSLYPVSVSAAERTPEPAAEARAA